MWFSFPGLIDLFPWLLSYPQFRCVLFRQSLLEKIGLARARGDVFELFACVQPAAQGQQLLYDDIKQRRQTKKSLFFVCFEKIHCSSTGNISTLMFFTWSLFVQIFMGIWWTHHKMIGAPGLCFLFLSHFNGFSEASGALAFWEITKNLS